MKSTKRLGILITIFFLVLGFGFFVKPNIVKAAEDNDRVCEAGEPGGDTDNDGVADCRVANENTLCERGESDNAGPNGIIDCDGSCDPSDKSGSLDCDGSCAQGTDDPCSVDCDPLGQCPTGNIQLGRGEVRTTVMRIINVALGFLGTIAVIIILYGGFKWMTSSGSEDKVSEARKLMFMGVVGLAIILAAYSITTFVIQGLLEATQ